MVPRARLPCCWHRFKPGLITTRSSASSVSFSYMPTALHLGLMSSFYGTLVSPFSTLHNLAHTPSLRFYSFSRLWTLFSPSSHSLLFPVLARHTQLFLCLFYICGFPRAMGSGLVAHRLTNHCDAPLICALRYCHLVYSAIVYCRTLPHPDIIFISGFHSRFSPLFPLLLDLWTDTLRYAETFCHTLFWVLLFF